MAVVQPVLVPGGGTEAVTAWTIEALKNQYDVSLVTFSSLQIEVLDRYYGTELGGSNISIVRPGLPPLLKQSRRFLLLKDHLMMRYCKSVRNRFDLFIGVGGVMDFGSPGVQYMALAPGSTLVKVLGGDPGSPRWYRLFKLTFMGLSQLISSWSRDRVLQNTTLVTSRWAGEVIERLYGISHWKVLYPPVSVPAAKGPWSLRENGFLCIARISPEKRIERAIEIVKQLRERGLDICLRIVGRQDDLIYAEQIKQLCEQNGTWAVSQDALPREELRSLMARFKYGINAASDEPFGISIAEMVTAGCIVFVHDSGGQKEIVDDPRLIYCDIPDAVDKITKVLESETLQESLLARLENRDEIFSTQAFCSGMQKVVHEFFATS